MARKRHRQEIRQLFPAETIFGRHNNADALLHKENKS